MKVVTLASGSKGNCCLITSSTTSILIDAGLPLGEIENHLAYLGVWPKDINAILVTHEHGDHIKSVGAFSRKYNTKVFAHQNEWKVLNSKLGKLLEENIKSFELAPFVVGDFKILPFQVPHDSFSCFGFTISENDNQMTIATDLGEITDDILNFFNGSTLAIIEANHEVELLAKNVKYSAELKRRILSTYGHLSNDACADAVSKLYTKKVRQIILGHLSEENNSPSLAYNKIKQTLFSRGIVEGIDIFIDVATQRQIGNMFEITSAKEIK